MISYENIDQQNKWLNLPLNLKRLQPLACWQVQNLDDKDMIQMSTLCIKDVITECH